MHIAKEDVEFISGGMGVHIRDVSAELAKLGIEQIILCLDFRQGGEIVENFLDSGVKVVKVFNHNIYNYDQGQSMIDDIVTEHQFYLSLAIHLQDEHFDLIHLHDSQLFNVARFAGAYYHCPLVMTCHLSLFLSHPYDIGEKFQYMIKREGAAYHYCNALATVSAYYKRLLEDTFMLAQNVTNVWNGVNFEELRQVQTTPELHKKYRNGKQLTIGFVGRMVNTKGIDLLLAAAEAFPQYQFNVVSTVLPTMEEILDIIRRVNAYIKTHDNLHWYKRHTVAEKWEIMKASDIAVMPSFHEPFGIVALEWMSLGIPLIVSNVEGLGDFCTPENSWLFDPGVVENPEYDNFVKAINAFRQDDARIAKGVETARKMNWASVAQAYVKMYETIITPNNQGENKHGFLFRGIDHSGHIPR